MSTTAGPRSGAPLAGAPPEAQGLAFRIRSGSPDGQAARERTHPKRGDSTTKLCLTMAASHLMASPSADGVRAVARLRELLSSTSSPPLASWAQRFGASAADARAVTQPPRHRTSSRGRGRRAQRQRTRLAVSGLEQGLEWRGQEVLRASKASLARQGDALREQGRPGESANVTTSPELQAATGVAEEPRGDAPGSRGPSGRAPRR